MMVGGMSRCDICGKWDTVVLAITGDKEYHCFYCGAWLLRVIKELGKWMTAQVHPAVGLWL